MVDKVILAIEPGNCLGCRRKVPHLKKSLKIEHAFSDAEQ
jgi:hypothetical protein